MMNKLVSVGDVEIELFFKPPEKIEIKNGILKSIKKVYEIIGYIIKNKGHPLIL